MQARFAGEARRPREKQQQRLVECLEQAGFAGIVLADEQRDVIEIQQKLPDETQVHFYSCHKCEEKWWNRDGEPMSLSEVLQLARKQST